MNIEENRRCEPVIADNYDSPMIYYYRSDGTIYQNDVLCRDTLRNINGMMVRCFMQNGSVQIGYAEPYRASLKSGRDFESEPIMYLWTWENLDEESHTLHGDDLTKFNQTHTPIRIDRITRIDAILYSNPRLGGRLTNKFYVEGI
jgi:hypothetical protein